LAGITYGEAAQRALALRCPRCGRGPLFRTWFTMYPRCTDCGFVFERAPGFFLGSAYVNYAFMAVTLTALYLGLHYGAGLSNQVLAPPLLAYCIVVPLVLFRYARAWWLAMDCYFDVTGAEEDRFLEPPPHDNSATPARPSEQDAAK
jgi:uncharacterized protein (DUF983 family)